MIISIVRFCVRIFYKCVFRVTVSGAENIPKTGGVMLAPNHTSNWDPPFVGCFSPRQVNLIAKSELFKNKLTGWFLKNLGAFPVERGMADVEAIKTSIRLLKNGEVLVMFPHGRRIKQGEDTPIKDGAVMIALRSKVPVVPVYISGEYKFGKKIKLSFGEPMDLSEYYGQQVSPEKQKELSGELWNKMKALK